MSTIYFVVTVARQTEGEMIQLRFERAFKELAKAEQYVKNLAKVYVENIDVSGVGPVQFVLERSVNEVELDE